MNIGRARATLVGVCVFFLAVAGGGLRAQDSVDEGSQLWHPIEVEEISNAAPVDSVSTDVVAPAPAPRAPRAHRPQVAQPQEAAPAAAPSGGTTSVAADNGSSGTSTGSGGSSVNNNATVDTSTGITSEDEEPAP